MNTQGKVYLRMILYILITAVITFATLLDSFTNLQIEVFSKFDWVKLTFKAFIPSLVSLKAFLDNTVSETLYNAPQTIGTVPQYSVSTQDIVQGLNQQQLPVPQGTTTPQNILAPPTTQSPITEEIQSPRRFPRAT